VSLVTGRRRCWDCWHCLKWTATPGSWVGVCGMRGAADWNQYVWLERDTCGYFEISESLTPLEAHVDP